jgi:hypothetical protein
MKLHCQENKQGRNENLLVSSGFRVPSFEFAVWRSAFKRSKQEEDLRKGPGPIGPIGLMGPMGPGSFLRSSFPTEPETLPPRQHLQQESLEIFGLGNMRKNCMVEWLREALHDAHVTLRVHAGVHNDLQKRFPGNVM